MGVPMELLEGQDLLKWVRKNKARREDPMQNASYQKECAILIGQLLTALVYIHKKGIAHLDLKLDNLVFKTSKTKWLKLIDFDCAHEGVYKGLVGTLVYMAPEIARQCRKRATCQSAIWSV